MKTNKKGFTLIELLAVIVILAIIALIAVPVILNILTKSRQSAAEDTAYSVLNAAELYYAEQLLEHPTEAFESATFNLPADANKADGTGLRLKGTVPGAGSVTVDKNGKATITAALSINNLSCTQSTTNTNEVECK